MGEGGRYRQRGRAIGVNSRGRPRCAVRGGRAMTTWEDELKEDENRAVYMRTENYYSAGACVMHSFLDQKMRRTGPKDATDRPPEF